MSHMIFNVLDDLELLKQRNRLKKILGLPPSDFSLLLDNLERSYASDTFTINSEPGLFDLWLPFPSQRTINTSQNYLFLFDRVYLLDPIYDLCSWLSVNDTNLESFINFYTENEGVKRMGLLKLFEEADETAVDIAHRLRLAAAKRLDETIQSLLKRKDLIDEGALIPYMTTQTGVYPDAAIHFIETMAKDISFKNIFDFKTALSLMEIQQFFATVVDFKTLFPCERASSLDIGTNNNKRILDKVIEIAADFLGENKDLFRGINWPTPEHELITASIGDIPPHELLTIREKEKPAIDSFRHKLQIKLLNLRATVGSKEYSQILQKLRLEQRSQISEINLVAKNIKRNYLRRLGHQISIITFSSAWTILSATAVTTNPIALLGMGIGSSGLATSISNLIDTWISYRSEIDKLREKDLYVLWRIQQKTHC